jgi:hypothetical protein
VIEALDMHENILMKWLLSGPASMRRRPAECALEGRVYRRGRVDPAFALLSYLQEEGTPMNRSGRGRDFVLIVTAAAVIAATVAVLITLIVRRLQPAGPVAPAGAPAPRAVAPGRSLLEPEEGAR